MPTGWQSMAGWHYQPLKRAGLMGDGKLATGKQVAPAVHFNRGQRRSGNDRKGATRSIG
jgi:hypothetical protein